VDFALNLNDVRVIDQHLAAAVDMHGKSIKSKE